MTLEVGPLALISLQVEIEVRGREVIEDVVHANGIRDVSHTASA